MRQGLASVCALRSIDWGSAECQGLAVGDVSDDGVLDLLVGPGGTQWTYAGFGGPPVPGEARELRVRVDDGRPGTMAVAYRPACNAVDHDLVFGHLEAVGRYEWTGRVCDASV